MTLRARFKSLAVILSVAVIGSMLAVVPVSAVAPGSSFAFGRGGNGQIGDGSTTDRSTPVGVSGLTSGVIAMAGGFFHSLALRDDGTVLSWGMNGSGQLGRGSSPWPDQPLPGAVTGLPAIASIDAYGYQSAALDVDGNIYQWGSDFYTVNQVAPKLVALPGGVKATMISVGQTHSLALGTDGNVYAWGSNCYGQIGDSGPMGPASCNPPDELRSTPVQVPGISGVTAIAAGQWHSVAIAGVAATIHAWGYNAQSQLGDGSSTTRNVPVAAQSGGLPAAGFTAIEAGSVTTLALKGDGTVWQTGYPGPGLSSSSFTQMPGVSGASQIASGEGANFALVTGGTVKAWGDNSNGQLGNGTTTSQGTPPTTVSITGVSAVFAGGYTNYAIRGVPTIDLDPGTFDYGVVTVGSSSVKTSTVSNTGDAPLAITSANMDASADFSLVLNECDGQTLATGESCTVSVRYSPSDVGEDSGGLFFNSNAVNSSVYLILQGNGVASAISALSLSVSQGCEISCPPIPSTGPGADKVNVLGIPVSEIPQGTAPTATLPVGKFPVGKFPVGKFPVGKFPVGKFPVGKFPVGKFPVGKFPVGKFSASVIGGSPLSRFPITRPGGWQAILRNIPGLSDGTPENTRFYQLFQVSPLPPEFDPTSPTALRLEEFNLAQSPLGNLTALTLLLGELKWSDVNGITEAELTAVDADCVGTAGLGTYIFEAEISGCPVDQTSLPGKTIGDINPLAIGNTVFWNLTIADSLKYNVSFLNAIVVSSLATPSKVVNCSVADCSVAGGLKLGDPAAVANIRTGDEGDDYGRFSTLGAAIAGQQLQNLIPAFAPLSSLPWVEIKPEEISVAGYGDAKRQVNYNLSFSINCDLTSEGVSATIDPHGGFRYIPGSSGEIEPTVSPDGSFTFVFPSCYNSDSLGSYNSYYESFQMMPGFTLGIADNDVTVTANGAQAEALGQAAVRVVESAEPNGDPGHAINLPVGSLGIGQIGTSGDVDLYKFNVAEGQSISAGLQVPAGVDLDMVLYGPPGFVSATNLTSGTPQEVSFGKLPVQGVGQGYNGGTVRPEMGQEIPLLDGLPIAGVSAFRSSDNEFVTSQATVAGEYILQVNGHDGSHGDHSYLSFVSTGDPQPLPPCTPRTFAFAGQGVAAAAGELTAPGANISTLIVLNKKRLGDSYGSARFGDIMTSLNSLLASPAGANMKVVPVDASTDVNGAFNALDANPCDPELSNAVVSEINDVIQAQRAGGNVQNVVVVGSDEVIPHARIFDGTVDANQVGYAGDVLLDSDPGPTVNANNALAGAFGASYFLSDNPYGTITPISVYGQLVYLPVNALGRLAETAADITAQIDQFRISNGVADPRTSNTLPRKAFESDYDFVTDGGTAMYNSLSAQVGAANVTRLTGPNWNRADLESALLGGTPPYVAALNGHFDHHEALPSAGNTADSTNDLFTTDHVSSSGASLVKRIIYSVGCHFGLNVDNRLGAGLVGASDLADRTAAFDGSTLNDWTEAFARKGVAIAVGNLGYGIGDLNTIGYSEQFMVNFTKYLDGSRTVGRGLVDARFDYYLSSGSFTNEDVKVIEQTVLWGFPNYTVPATLGVAGAGAITPINTPSTDPISGLTAYSFNVVPSFTTNNAPNGRQYVSADNGVQVTTPYPIMPKVTTGFTSVTGKKPTFFAPMAMSFTDSSITQAFGNATVDSATEGAPAGNVVFPAVFQNITTAPGPVGQRYQGVILPAQYYPGADPEGPGTIRKFTNSTYMAFYGNSAAQPKTPLVSDVEATQVGVNTAITAHVSNPAGSNVVRVWAMVLRNGATAYEQVDLGHGAGDLWTGGVTGSNVQRVDLYAVNSQGGGASATFKGVGYPVTPTPSGPALPPGDTLTVTGGTSNAGWFRNNGASVPQAIVDGPTGADYRISVDGGAPQTQPVPLTVDGFHTLQAVEGDGTVVEGAIIVGIDNTRPSVYIYAPANGATYGLNQVVPENYKCVDTGSGVASCTDSNPTNSANTSPVGSKTFTSTAVDIAGNAPTIASTAYTVNYSSIGPFQPPVDTYNATSRIVNSANLNQTIPFKFQILDGNGDPVPNATAGYSWTPLAASACGGSGVVDPVPADTISITSGMIYDPAAQRYQWNIKPKDKLNKAGCYMFTLKTNDNSTVQALFQLK